MTAERRQLSAAVLGAVAAGGLALMAGGQAWARVTVDRPAPLPPVESTLSGGSAAPLVPAAGLVLLAAAVALLAVRGIARAAVGLLVVVAGAVLVWSGVRTLTGGVDAAEVRDATVDVAAAWPVLAVVAGVLGAAAGVLAVVRGRSWPAMGRRYERPGGAAAGGPAGRTDEDRVRDAWTALDRGDDPTADLPDRSPAPRRAPPL
jgi:uncharacterized membrane protein (TIGR02234 family)